jgi:hypothetical protein
VTARFPDDYQYDRKPLPPMSQETRDLLAGLRVLAVALAIVAVLVMAGSAAFSSTRAADRCERSGGAYSNDAGCVEPHPLRSDPS